MKPGAFFQRLWECFALSVCVLTLAFIGYSTYIRIAHISVDCTHLSEITLFQVWNRKTSLKLKLTPGSCNDPDADVLYARFDKDLSGMILRGAKNNFYITVIGRTFWGKRIARYKVSGDIGELQKLFDEQMVKFPPATTPAVSPAPATSSPETPETRP